MLGLDAKLATEMSTLGLIGVGALHENTALKKEEDDENLEYPAHV